MKIIYSKGCEEEYLANPVESPDRVRVSAALLRERGCQFIEPEPASMEDIARVHGREHIDRVRASGHLRAASLAAGAAIAAAKLALQGEPAFALARPPGHHASANRAWGMCYLNNMAIALQRIRPKARKALILDIDLHFGDGTVSIFRADHDVKIVNPGSIDENFEYLSQGPTGYLKQIETALECCDYEVIGVSAGFDTYLKDWGGLLAMEDYETIGRTIASGSQRCRGRRFGILEGGYHEDLSLNILSFIKGFAEK